MVRRRVPVESRRCALEQGDRRTDRAQLARRQRARSWRRRSWTQSSGRDCNADRGAPRGSSDAGYCRGAGRQMRSLRKHPRTSRAAHAATEAIGGPLVWTFDGAFATCLADMEDALRRAIVQVGDVASIAVMVELSLPALRSRVGAGEAIQPAWGRFLDSLTSRYGLPAAPRVRHLKAD